MASVGPIIREIHRLRSYVSDLETKITQAPRTLKSQHNKVANQDGNLKAALDEIKHIKVKIAEKELGIKTAIGLIKKYEKQLSEASVKKEYDALKAEIAQSNESIKKLEDEILEHLAEIDDKQAKIPEIEAVTKKTRDEAAQFERDYQSRLQRFQEEVEKARVELKAVEATLPEDIVPIYKRAVRGGVDSFSGVTGKTCVACYTEVTPQFANELLNGKFVICQNCGRMLYSA